MLTRSQFQNLAHFLIPHVEANRTTIQTAVRGSSLEHLIDWKLQPTHDFVYKVLEKVHTFGKLDTGNPALVDILRALQGVLGVDRQRVLGVWIVIIQSQATSQKSVDADKRQRALLDVLDCLTAIPGMLYQTAWLGLTWLVLDKIDPTSLSEPMQDWFVKQTDNPLFDVWSRLASGETLRRDGLQDSVNAALRQSDVEAIMGDVEWLLLLTESLTGLIDSATSGGYVKVVQTLVGRIGALLDDLEQREPALFQQLQGLSQQINQLSGQLQTVDMPVPAEATDIKIFISSPGDVPQERKIAQEVIQNLADNPQLQGMVSFDVIAWDKPGASTPMLATMTPQEAINQGLAMPSECDIVVVIFWSRMGTPLPHPEYQKPDGTQYLSGTEWEYWDAYDAGMADGLPLLVVYRRMEEPQIGLRDAERDKKIEQFERIENFFDSFTNADGSIKQGYNQYQKPEDFRREFETHLRKLVIRLIEAQPQQAQQPSETSPAKPVATWEGSPFPGLRAFTEKEAPIFFGRGRETDRLVQMVEQSRFVAVVGASGSGKSSLVGAGLIPRLRENAIDGSRDWYIVCCTPSESPFVNLAEALIGTVPTLAGDPIEIATRAETLADILRRAPENLDKTLSHALKDEADWSQVVVFVDQFEELLTLTPVQKRKSFVEMLTNISEKVRVIVTMRGDFYHQMIPYLEKQLRGDGTFTLNRPSPIALYEMIVRPAERAGLNLENGLAERIVKDTGYEPGALALMAYLLDELYNMRKGNYLTHIDFEELGGVAKSISVRAENVYQSLIQSKSIREDTLWKVFRELAEVDIGGVITRRPLILQADNADDATRNLVYAFSDARLLTMSNADKEKLSIVEVAHESLLNEWVRLSSWLLKNQDYLRLLRQFERDAEQWWQRNKPEVLQPKSEQLVYFELALDQLGISRDTLSVKLQVYTEPEQERLLNKITNVHITHYERSRVGERLSVIGDTRFGVGLREDGIPEIEWLGVGISNETEVAKIAFEDADGRVYGHFKIEPFFIAKYLVTCQQFQAFVDNKDGYQNTVWWKGLNLRHKRREKKRFRINNNPIDDVVWDEAVAFSRWLNNSYKGEKLLHPNGISLEIGVDIVIRLPLEFEWQWVAQAKQENREYPWGDWIDGYANTIEAGLNRVIAVGMYPHAAAQCGALDMAGNTWEWCLNDWKYFEAFVETGREARKAQRGGSFSHIREYAACASRGRDNLYTRMSDNGIRLVVAPEINLARG